MGPAILNQSEVYVYSSFGDDPEFMEYCKGGESVTIVDLVDDGRWIKILTPQNEVGYVKAGTKRTYPSTLNTSVPVGVSMLGGALGAIIYMIIAGLFRAVRNLFRATIGKRNLKQRIKAQSIGKSESGV